MSFGSSLLSHPHAVRFFFSNSNNNCNNRTSRFKAAAEVPDSLSADWYLFFLLPSFRFIHSLDADSLSNIPIDRFESRKKRPFGPRLDFSAEDAVHYQLEALKHNDQPRQDYGIEVMYRFAGFNPFERSTYFGPFFDLGQFERFRRIFHHSTYRVLLAHKERKIMSSLFVEENKYKQRVWIRGSRPEEEEIFQFTMVQLLLVSVSELGIAAEVCNWCLRVTGRGLVDAGMVTG
ncbi:hypothetical protein Fmac_000753 [Flemingia macrophylla]|uniref:Uncharacterized protein n=1 Tax=Flemingia macrophylla TaxID=520843 RepID=A0ABD1NF55_9FABA